MTGTEETRELARALNGLAERTVELLAAERESVADLSHRLRTPVTALRLDAEAVTEPELAHRLQDHIAALQRTIDAIVKEARRPVRTDLTARCDAVETIGARVAFWAALAEDQGRPMEVLLPTGPVHVVVSGEDLVDVVDILVDNVFAHTPEHAAFSVLVRADSDELHLVVQDRGPGVWCRPRPDGAAPRGSASTSWRARPPLPAAPWRSRRTRPAPASGSAFAAPRTEPRPVRPGSSRDGLRPASMTVVLLVVLVTVVLVLVVLRAVVLGLVDLVVVRLIGVVPRMVVGRTGPGGAG